MTKHDHIARYRQRHAQAMGIALGLQLGQAIQAEMDRRKIRRVKYRKASGGEGWITIGGSPSGGKRHAGGTPVRLDESGRITAGPANLEGFQLKPPKEKEYVPKEKQRTLVETEGPPEATDEVSRLKARIAELEAGESKPEPQPSQKQDIRGIDASTLEHHPDGRLTGVSLMTPQELDAGPDRFQYKITGIGETGVTKELSEVERFRPEFGGQLLVWHDPGDGKTYVVNGHHRYELAKRTGYTGHMPSYFIDVDNAQDARAMGALANIAGTHGSAIDAAQFFRESDVTPDMLRGEGVSLKGHIADNGMVLSKLSDQLFGLLKNDMVSERRGLAIAGNLEDHNLQDELIGKIRQKEEKHKSYSDAAVEQMAKRMQLTSTVTEHQTDLFGDYEETRSLVVEAGDILNELRREISTEARAFRSQAVKGREELLGKAGNVLADRETNQRYADEAAGLLEKFDLETTHKGETNDVVNEFAKQLAAARNAREEKSVIATAKQRIRGLLAGGSTEGGENLEQNPGGPGEADRTGPSEATEVRGGNRPYGKRSQSEGMIEVLRYELFHRNVLKYRKVT